MVGEVLAAPILLVKVNSSEGVGPVNGKISLDLLQGDDVRLLGFNLLRAIAGVIDGRAKVDVSREEQHVNLQDR